MKRFRELEKKPTKVYREQQAYSKVAKHYMEHQNFEGFETPKRYVSVIEKTLDLYGKVYLDMKYAKKMIIDFKTDSKMVAKVNKVFLVGMIYSNQEIKLRLQKVYDENSFRKTAIAKHITNYMNVHIVNNKEVKGYMIDSKL